MESLLTFICPTHGFDLILDEFDKKYLCPSGCSFPIIENIPRFVPLNNYALSFGLQWNKFSTTQLDSYTGTFISKDRLTRLAGGSLDIFRGKKVLEAGCGAGRFTEILLQAGAKVFAVDISAAVDANYKNCNKYPDYFVCQADILNLPVQPEQFDIVICVGVIQHTPNPEQTMTELCKQVKPGGLLVIDHYTHGYPVTLSRRFLRAILLRIPKGFSLEFCKILTALLWPLHRMFWKYIRVPFVSIARSLFLHLSPVVDYHDAYPQLGQQLLKAWATLDTHDTLTDCYKHLRSAEEIKTHLQQCGMIAIETVYAGNGVEARAHKPLKEGISTKNFPIEADKGQS
jgi:SAM-dependent methyltransferase